MHKTFNSMTQSVFANMKDHLQIVDIKSPCLKEMQQINEWRQAWVHLLCRPDFENLPTALHVEAIP